MKIALAGLFLCYILFLSWFRNLDHVTNYYPTLSDAKNDRLFERGWLPEILPNETFNIYTSNDVDSNTSNGSFTIPHGNIRQFVSLLEKRQDNSYTFYNAVNLDNWIFNINLKNGLVKYMLTSHFTGAGNE